MKKLLLIPGLLLTGFLLFQAFVGTVQDPDPVEDPDPGPQTALDIISTSCFDCHSNMGQNDKPKDALNFDLWESYNTGKKIAKLSDICEMIEEGKMPPEKYLKFKPEHALTDESREVICAWVEEETGKLMGGE